MANQQAFQQYGHTNKGTLQPGQTISVNKYNVQVERYLSQGGFAHVYLVRTAVPVYNTTHHVLKRIAVANEIMLTEVKKEVDIMRILKGHPNIVHLIDAAWHRMPNGHYEVFILMEFCAGGGIIDMMNRRLRERLTEAEILQIFVDVCEGVAAMHNLRPALLHRDLKVENILQSSPTSFKLCDFGSATAVAPKPPTTTQEIRALEADLNRHTTLQYRAPEMVDPYLRRPVDEKSDVWALGVLLYKLCYYTTPFEEHGPLAILNVQYRTPPYPVYSTQMNTLIASMLREHGAQRPSVFEILAHVHRLRGTKSRFTYTIPTPQPLAAPHAPPAVPESPLDNIVAFRPPQNQASISPLKNAGVQAREKVLEAIAPMRRGRPTVAQTPEPKSRQSSPQKEKAQAQVQAQSKIQSWLDEGFATEEEKVWKPVKSTPGMPPIRGHRSGVAAVDTSKVRHPAPPAIDDAWNLEGRSRDKPKISPGAGFENDFADKLWDSFRGPSKDVSESASRPVPVPSRPPAVSNDSPSTNKLTTPRKGQDAFEGLGLSPSDRPPPQTLGEARKLRTGLTVNSSNKSNNISPSLSNQASRPPSSSAPRPSPSPRPSQYSPAPPRTSSPRKPSPTNASKPSTLTYSGEVSAEARFPSLEQLDATFHTPPVTSTTPQTQHISERLVDLSSPPPRPRMNSNASSSLRPAGQHSYLKDGVRSEQVTGIAMREAKGTRAEGVQRRPVEESVDAGVGAQLKRTTTRPIRPSLSRKHRSSISIKHPHQSGNDVLGSPVVVSPAGITSPRFPEPKDWLTGNDEGLTSTAAATKSHPSSTETPVLREFTNKRESFIEATSTDLQSPQEVEQLPSLTSPTPTKAKYTIPKASRPLPSTNTTGAPKSPEKLVEHRSPVRSNTIQHHDKNSSSSDDGPEDPNGFATSKGLKRRKSSKKRKGRQSSVHDLVDLWGGGVVHLKEKDKDKDKEIIHSPTAGDYKSYGLDTQIKPLTRRPTYIPPSSNPISYSPQPILSSTPTRNSRPQRSPSQHRKLSSATATSDATQTQAPPSRGRPQSMLIFPIGNSKSDSTTVPSSSPALAPPEDVAPKRSRRTSISDMVQRYEAIGGKSKGTGAVVAPIGAQKPTVLKVATQNTSSGGNARPPRVSPGSRDNTTKSGSSLPIPDDGPTGVVAHTRHRTSPTGLPRTSPSGYRESIWTREVENPNAMLRQSSPPKSATISDEPSTPDLQTSQFSSPSWKATTTTEDSSQPSSPERPYQGVGKLIDQWQRKTADAEPDRNLHSRRGGIAGKRPLPGLVGGGVGRGR